MSPLEGADGWRFAELVIALPIDHRHPMDRRESSLEALRKRQEDGRRGGASAANPGPRGAASSHVANDKYMAAFDDALTEMQGMGLATGGPRCVP